MFTPRLPPNYTTTEYNANIAYNANIRYDGLVINNPTFTGRKGYDFLMTQSGIFLVTQDDKYLMSQNSLAEANWVSRLVI